jgi:hypothetical protein
MDALAAAPEAPRVAAAPAARFCTACGARAAADAKFCSACGTALSQS